MARITQNKLAGTNTHLRLLSKIQSLKWDKIPEEIEAFFRNLHEHLSQGVGHGLYKSVFSTIKLGDTEFTRMVVSIPNDRKFIPSIQAFTSPNGRIYINSKITLVGEHDQEVDDKIAAMLVDYCCKQFDEPNEFVSIVLHIRWKKQATDTRGDWKSYEWGEEEACKLTSDLVAIQQQIAVERRNEYLAKRELHRVQQETLKDKNPTKDVHYSNKAPGKE